MIKIFVVDDHQAYRDGLRILIDSADDMEMVGEASSGISAMQNLQQVTPDLILMDVQMPDENGVELTVRVKDQYPAIHVLMVTMFAEAYSVQAAKEAGACGYILKGINHNEMLQHIRVAAEGGEIYQSQIS